MIAGIDVSNHQADIDWTAVAADGKEFAIAKASEALTYRDPWFSGNLTGAIAQGLVVGSYHFCRPSVASGRDEALYYLDAIGHLHDGELLAFDLEDEDVDAGADLLPYALEFKRTIQQRAGFLPLFYSAPAYMAAHNLTGDTPEHRELAECGLWLAHYREDWPDVPAPWPFVAIWQHSSKGQVAGVNGNCDLDWFNGDSVDRLRSYGKPMSGAEVAPGEAPAVVPPAVPSFQTVALAHITEGEKHANAAAVSVREALWHLGAARELLTKG